MAVTVNLTADTPAELVGMMWDLATAMAVAKSTPMEWQVPPKGDPAADPIQPIAAPNNVRDTITYWHHPESSSVFSIDPGEPLPTDGLTEEVDRAAYNRLKAEYEKAEQESEQAAESAKAEPAATPSVTKEDVRAKLAGLVQAGKQSEVAEILKRFGGARLSDVPETKYGELMAEAVKVA